MNTPDHLTNDLLVRAIDDELSPREMSVVESHLRDCEVCKRRHAGVLRLSGDIESLVAAVVPEAFQDDRDGLVKRLETARAQAAVLKTGRNRMRALWWGAGLAATVLLSVLLMAHRIHTPLQEEIAGSPYRSDATFEVDGETFIRLPYSDPSLPVNAAHIVEMQVPASSLASAGLVFEPVANGASGSEPSVLADVLLGLDGQPLGVHVLSME